MPHKNFEPLKSAMSVGGRPSVGHLLVEFEVLVHLFFQASVVPARVDARLPLRRMSLRPGAVPVATLEPHLGLAHDDSQLEAPCLFVPMALPVGGQVREVEADHVRPRTC